MRVKRGVTRHRRHRKVLKQTEPGRLSSKRPRRTTSASVITYQEVWSVEGSPELPVFVRKEFLSGARSDSLEGITRYTAESASPNGDRIEGAYTRDGTRRGSFRLTRSGGIRGLEKKTREERQRQALVRFLESDEMRRVAQEVFRERVREDT